MQFAYGRQLRTNPLIETYGSQKKMFMVLWVMFFFITVVTAFEYLTSPLTMASFLRFLDHGSPYLFLTICYPFIYLNARAQLSYWRKIEPRRLAAANRRDLWIAAEQPIANPTALRLPYTIISPLLKRPRLSDYAMIVLFILMFAFISASVCSHLFLVWQDRWHAFLVVFVAVILLSGSLTMVSLIFNRVPRFAKIKILVTEQGITVGKTQMYWGEAQLFALYQTYNGKRPGTSITYELSSGADVLRWTTVESVADVQPNDADMEYAQQLQALSQMVVARTGLPLADLCDRPVKG